MSSYEERRREARMRGYEDVLANAVIMTMEELRDVMRRVMLFIEQHGCSRFARGLGDSISDCAGIKVYSRKKKRYLYYFYPYFFGHEFGISPDSLLCKIDLIRPFVPRASVICDVDFFPNSAETAVVVWYIDNVEHCLDVDVALMEEYLSRYFGGESAGE